MEGLGEKKPWGKLSRLLGAEAEASSELLLCKKEWTIGRKKGCDLSFPGNKLVSGEHCKIRVDETSGVVFLEDTSTNGTVINQHKVVKKQSYTLKNGDVIYVVFKKNEPEQNVAFLYRSLNSAQDNMQESSVRAAPCVNGGNLYHLLKIIISCRGYWMTQKIAGNLIVEQMRGVAVINTRHFTDEGTPRRHFFERVAKEDMIKSFEYLMLKFIHAEKGTVDLVHVKKHTIPGTLQLQSFSDVHSFVERNRGTIVTGDDLLDTSGEADATRALSPFQDTSLTSEEPQPSTSTSNLYSTPTTSSQEPLFSVQIQLSPADAACTAEKPQEDKQSKVDCGGQSFTNVTSDTNQITTEKSDKEQDDNPPPKKKLKVESDCSSSRGPAILSDSKGTTEDLKKPDKMEETLTCIICQELLHDCVSLQPCMHTFCAACYSGWMERSSLCPTCRCPVERICKNHILNNLVEAYLLQHPEKCRSEEDRRSMDARNKITQDMLQPKVRRSFSDEEGSSEDLLDLSDVDSESSDLSQPYTVCRQCPGYGRHIIQPHPYPLPIETEAVRTLGDAPSTSANFPAAAQEYVCSSQGSHVICTCCFQPMPDRRSEREQNPHVAPQQCTVCLQSFCHMYWGCTGMSCLGCLAPFCELNLGEKCLDSVLNNNNYESDILKNYLASRGLTWKDLLHESLAAVQRGACMLPDYRINGNTVLCYFCGLRNFRDLTYQYRQNIPPSELPVAVTSRPNCYWGRNCRTQVKAHHAMRFNHICEQTRFKN